MATDEGVDGSETVELTMGGTDGRNGDDVRPRASTAGGSRESRTEVRMGEVGGKTSSAGFRRGGLVRPGEPEGLEGRRNGRARPLPSRPDMDLVRAIEGRARETADLDRVWVPARGEVVLGR